MQCSGLLRQILDSQHQGYGAEIMCLLENWLKRQNIKVIKMHSRLSAEHFYRKLGYIEMPFDDPSIQERYIDLGKVL
jgi:histone acetyltransferase (RNA polymerase elongator complex component)